MSKKSRQSKRQELRRHIDHVISSNKGDQEEYERPMDEFYVNRQQLGLEEAYNYFSYIVDNKIVEFGVLRIGKINVNTLYSISHLCDMHHRQPKQSNCRFNSNIDGGSDANTYLLHPEDRATRGHVCIFCSVRHNYFCGSSAPSERFTHLTLLSFCIKISNSADYIGRSKDNEVSPRYSQDIKSHPRDRIAAALIRGK